MAAPALATAGERAQHALLKYCSISIGTFGLIEGDHAREAWYAIAALSKSYEPQADGSRDSDSGITVTDLYDIARVLGINRGAQKSERYAFQASLSYLARSKGYIKIFDKSGGIVQRERASDVLFSDRVKILNTLQNALINHAADWCEYVYDRPTVDKINNYNASDRKKYQNLMILIGNLLFHHIGVTFSNHWLRLLDTLERAGLSRETVQADAVLWIVVQTLLYLRQPTDYVRIVTVLSDFDIRLELDRFQQAMTSVKDWRIPADPKLYAIPESAERACENYLRIFGDQHDDFLEHSRREIGAALRALGV